MSPTALVWRGLAIAGAIGLAAVAAVAWQVRGRNRLRFEYATGPMAPDAYAALAGRPGWTAWSVPVGAGVQLRGLVKRPAAPDAPWILFYPGNDPAQLATGQRAVERMIGTDDWGGAVIAYRGFDGSGGEPGIEALRHDGTAILVSLLASEHLAPQRVHAVGFSIGGHIAAAVTAEQARQRAPLASLSLLASVNDIVMLRHSPFVLLSPGDALQTAPLLGDVPAPVLVVQGDRDEALDGPGQGRAIAATLGRRAQYIELPGVGHVMLLTNEVALMRVHDFVATRPTGEISLPAP